MNEGDFAGFKERFVLYSPDEGHFSNMGRKICPS